MTVILAPIPYFIDGDGDPLDNGMIYVGTAGMDARGNPIQLYWDEALTIPASQPLRTNIGYPAYQGAASSFYTASTAYSITVLDKNGVVVVPNMDADAVATATELGFSRSATYSASTTRGALSNQPITVKDNPYLALGNGVADDTAALVAAAASGREVTLPPGSYLIDPTVFSGYTSFRLRGAGRDVTKIILATTGTALTFSNCQWLQLSDFSLELDGGAGAIANTSGIQLDTGSSNAIIERMNFSGFATSGLRLFGTSGTGLTGNIVDKCYFLGNSLHNIYGEYNMDYTLSHNQHGWLGASFEADYGTLLTNCQEGTYFSNYHWHNEVGFKSVNGNGSRYIGNRFEENNHEGVWLEGGNDELFEANTVHTNSQTADGTYDNVYVASTSRLLFTGNKIRTWNALYSKWGVNFDTGCDEIGVSKNQIRGFDTTNFGPMRVAGGVARISQDMFLHGTATNVAAGASAFLGVGAETAEAAALIQVPCRLAAIVLNCASLAAPGGAETYVYTLRKNGADEAMTVTITGAGFAGRITSTSPQILFDAGDQISVRVTASGSATVTSHRFNLQLVEY